jgi:DNA polymerase-1
VDDAFLADMSRRLQTELNSLSARIYAAAGTEFNINSPRQLADVLFGKLQLPVLKKTRKTGTASTDTEVLEELAISHELPRLILDYRALGKLKGTYVDTLPSLVHPQTGRVHTSYNQTVAATGRLSSSDPNLQNIPVRTEAGREIRRAFVPEPGHQLVAADYSQIELRLVAHLSADPGLEQAFLEGEDVHRSTAARMFGVAPGDVDTELRHRAKAINFGIIYGMSAYGLSRQLQCPPADARALIEQYFSRYSGIRRWIDETLALARETGVVTTLLGRLRYLPEINARLRNTREAAERVAINTPIQGTAADLIKLAMIRIDRRLRSELPEARMILQVHDELVFEVPEADVAPLERLVRAEMEGVYELSVPLVVDLGAGPNWLEAKA